MMHEGVYYSFTETSCIIRLVGEMKYTTVAHNFELFIDMLLEKTFICDVVVDMRECTYIDSTDLGILARIAVTQMKRGYPKPLIVHERNATVAKNITEIGLGHVFKMVTTVDLVEANFTSIKNEKPSDDLTLARLMVAAHKQLTDLDDENIARFGAVISFMEHEIAEMEKKSH